MIGNDALVFTNHIDELIATIKGLVVIICHWSTKKNFQ